MGRGKLNLSQLKTVASLRRKSLTNISSICSLEQDQWSNLSYQKPTRSLNSKIQKMNALKKNPKSRKIQCFVSLSKTGKSTFQRFPCFEEQEIFNFPKGFRCKLKNLTEDFDVESDLELIEKAVETQKKKVLKITGETSNER